MLPQHVIKPTVPILSILGVVVFDSIDKTAYFFVHNSTSQIAHRLVREEGRNHPGVSQHQQHLCDATCESCGLSWKWHDLFFLLCLHHTTYNVYLIG